jgi:hypothetical protein
MIFLRFHHLHTVDRKPIPFAIKITSPPAFIFFDDVGDNGILTK